MMFRGEITNVRAWETETVFRPTKPAAAAKPLSRTIAIGFAVAVSVAALAIVLAWPRFLTAPKPGETPLATEFPETTSHSETARSDLVPADDLIPSGDPATERDEVFVFSREGLTTPSRDEKYSPKGPAQSNVVTVQPPVNPTGTEADPLNARLLSDQPLTTSDKKMEPAAREVPCKADSRVALKYAGSDTSPSAASVPIKTSSTGVYNLGPRGGCYIVTPAGSKKYVDRSLCSQASAAAGRQ